MNGGIFLIQSDGDLVEMKEQPYDTEAVHRTISAVTRRNIFDTIRIEAVAWNGPLPEDDFLTRLFDLQSLPSGDGRFPNAAGDIWKHRVMNSDWEDHWVFTDRRFNLLHGPDEVFLRFLGEMLHPVVRDNGEEVMQLHQVFNEHLKADGWELYERTSISGRPVDVARRLLAEIRNLYGTGHGKHARSKGLQRRHARLAVGAASTLGVFLFETFQEKSK